MPSLPHRFLADVAPKLRRDSEVVDPERVRREALADQARADPAPPGRVTAGRDVAVSDETGFPVYEVTGAATRPRRSLVYLHGGAYVAHAGRRQWKYAVRLAERLNARLVFPIYPLAPRHTWRDAHPSLARLVEQVCIESPQGVTLAGDSAGGGLALALAQQLARRPGPAPRNLLLVSPWVDLTLSTPGTDRASARDPSLQQGRLRLAAHWWAGEDDPVRPELSPLFGELAGLPPALMFCGTRDTLYPQCRELAARAYRAGWALDYVEEADLVHNYPLLPVPEARRSLGLAVRFVETAA